MVRSPRWLSAGVMVAVLAGCLMLPARAEAATSVSFGFFYSNLSPHGSWLVSSEYGRVWQPYEYDRDWNPYYDGRWDYSDYGWTWVSDYRWGAIPYHYGTWYFDSYYGWVWVPGFVWAPSWVVFRTGPDYIGWCPVPPRYSVGASFRFREPRHDHFVFVSSRDFTSRRIRGAAIRDHRRSVIINNTRIVNNIRIENNVVVNRGPDVRSIERASGRQVRRYRIEEVPRVAPGRSFDRAQFRVNRRGSGGLRATEPIPKSRPLPSRGSARDDRRDDRRDEGRDDRRADRRDDRRDDRQAYRRDDRRSSSESRRDSRFGRPAARDREDRRPDLRDPSSGPEGRGSMREHDRSFDRDRRDSVQQPRAHRPGRTGQDRPEVRERDRNRDQRVLRERPENRQPQMRDRSPQDDQRQRSERPRREERKRDQRKERPREHKPDHDKPPHGN